MAMSDHLNPGLLVEDMPFPLLVVRQPDFQVIWVNSYAENWFGQSRKSLAGKALDFLTPETDNLHKSLAKVKDHGSVNIYDLSMARGDGQGPSLYISAFSHGDDIALILIPTERRASSSETSAPDAVGALGRMLAHELKNPLAGIKGAAQLLRTPQSNAEDVELITLISTETDRIRRLADRMESFAKFDDLDKGPVNIHSVLRQARLLAQSSSAASIEFTEVYDPSLPPVAGDNDALMQVAINLIVNAGEAISGSGHGGSIRLETAYRAGLRRQTQGNDQALPIEIRIIDDGPGIPDAMREQIFLPFVTDKPAGRGLGLTLVSRIITAHGGAIDVQSRPGKTVFSLSLPAGATAGSPQDADQ